jgi:hypothetical protein
MTQPHFNKLINGVYQMTHSVERHGRQMTIAIMLVKQQDGRWAGSFRSPFGAGGTVRVVRRTRRLAALECIARLDDDEELFRNL